MIKEFSEMIHRNGNMEFKGTIIDIETLWKPRVKGAIKYKTYEIEAYDDQTIISFGYLTRQDIDKDLIKLKIYCCENIAEIDQLNEKIKKGIFTLNRPYYAFQHYFEKYVIKLNCDVNIQFDYELNNTHFEKKENVVKELGIDSFNDPFNGVGGKCMESFNNGTIDDVIKHNRSCLLKEYEILTERGCREIRGNYVLRDGDE